MELRPLGFGELFDRAITLYLRNFRPFFAIVLLLVVPLAVVQYVVDSNQLRQIDALLNALQHPGSALPPASVMFGSSGAIAATAIVLVLFAVVWPFALDAVAVGVARIYRGRPVEFGACYRAVLPRWAAILATLALQIVAYAAWYVAVLIAMFASMLIAAVLLRAWLPLGIVGFTGAALITLAAICSLAPIFVALTFAMNAVVIENRGPISAIGSGFARIFTRGEFVRALLFSLAAGATVFAGSLVIAAVAWAALLLHAVAVEVVLGALLRAAFAPFSIVLVAVYYFDVRIRREGFDLEAELERLTAAAPSA